MRSASEVLAHGLKCLEARDLDSLLSDYASDAAFFNADGAQCGEEVSRLNI